MYLIDTQTCIGCGGCPPCCPECAIYDLYEYCVINGGDCNDCEGCWAGCPVESISRLRDAIPGGDDFDSYWNHDTLMDKILWWWNVPYSATPNFSNWSLGADCSWTVWKIYQDGGFNYPYTSCGFAWQYGMPFPFELVDGEYQDGDILLFATHMAIYVENPPSGENPDAHWFNARQSTGSHEFNTLSELITAVGSSNYKVYRWRQN